MTPTEEATRIYQVHREDLAAAMGLLERQLNVLHTRAQVLVSLAGAVVTVTGFSGRIIAATSLLGKVTIIAGLFIVIAAAVWVFSSVMRVKWVTTDLCDDPIEALERMIRRRNDKTQAYRLGGTVLFAGLVVYGVAVSLMLAAGGP